MEEQELRVRKIRDGTVIDHIPDGRALVVLSILGITGEEEEVVSIAMHVPSTKLGKKDIVKIENRFLKPEEVNKIALIAETATINIIREYRVVEKWKVKPPARFRNLIKCPNARCITNFGREPVEPAFEVIGLSPVKVRCSYCGIIVSGRDLLELVRQ
ncbi:MAG: aspartate carbamoyltransferase regulatory subunit [Thermoproteota archaeon]|nr:MAG: aspartate carbamoyltransferase regulatory subunit [Candidatus Korarchaeota archaeon]